MIVIKDKSRCCGCEACASVCPVDCLHMRLDGEGFVYPEVNEHVCINCHRCEDVCPISNYRTPDCDVNSAYAVRSKNSDVRLKSSSGGVFYHLTKVILDRGGVIVAPAFNDYFELEHVVICDYYSLNRAIGTKYVQSRMNDIYIRIEKLLKRRVLVYFAGTPCQVLALKRYLGRDYDELITQDLICHGVPSPWLWKKHLEYLSKDDERIEEVDFRDKSSGWRGYSLRVRFANGREYCEPSYSDFYLKAYSKDLSSRPACYECPVKGQCRVSDITLGDFWGIENFVASMDDDFGTSLVMIHTHKGKELFAHLKDEVDIQEVNCTEALIYNRTALVPPSPSKDRMRFFEELCTNEYMKVMKRYCRDGKLTEMKRFVRSTFSRMKRLLVHWYS